MSKGIPRNESLSRGFAKREPYIIMRIIRALSKNEGNIEHTAQTLRIDRETLRRWIKTEPKLDHALKMTRVTAITGKTLTVEEITKLRTENEHLKDALRAIVNGHPRPVEHAKKALLGEI